MVWVDPEGLHESESFWHNVFDPGVGGQQLGMSAKATASGVITGLTMGALSPDWRDPCDQYGTWSRNWGVVSGVATTAAIGAAAAGKDPWLGRLTRDPKPHGKMGPRLQLDMRTGVHRTTAIFRLPWR